MATPARGKCLLQDLLDKRGMSQTELAVLTDISQRMISFYCANRYRMNIDDAHIIAKVLECRIEDLHKFPE